MTARTVRAPLFFEKGVMIHRINLAISYITPRKTPHKKEARASEAISFCERSIKALRLLYASDRLEKSPRLTVGLAS